MVLPLTRRGVLEIGKEQELWQYEQRSGGSSSRGNGSSPSDAICKLVAVKVLVPVPTKAGKEDTQV